MHRPELVTPGDLPVSLDEVKLALRFDANDLDDEITAQIKSAVDHYQGWTGILGISLVDQEWRQVFDAFGREMCIPLGPVLATGMTVTCRNGAGQISTVGASNYALRIGLDGRASIRFDAGYSFPTDLHESGAVAVAYRAGFAEVPEDLKSAIKLRVKINMLDCDLDELQLLERVEANLISKYRRGLV